MVSISSFRAAGYASFEVPIHADPQVKTVHRSKLAASFPFGFLLTPAAAAQAG
jgi:hypothetical protein